MKRNLLVFVLTLSSNIIFSQTDKCKPILQKDFIDKIKDYKAADLVPYNVVNDSWQEKWGLMDKTTKKKLTEPLMNYASTFNPNISFFYEECDVKINNNYELNAKDLMVTVIEGDDSVDQKIQVLDSINGYKGFKVDDNGNLIAYSKAYFRDNWHSWNISKPFLYKNNYYAIVQNKEGNKTIINTEGEIKKGFVYKSLRYTDYQHKGENLLYAEDFKGKKGFITLSGHKLHYGKLLKSPFYSNELFGYSIQHDGIRGAGTYQDSISKSGILDLSTMKWLIKPKKGLKLIDMVYTSESVAKTDYTNRKNVNIYFVVLEDKFRYLIDEEGNKYIAK
ncbi:hypothetical protein H0I23_08525 [Cellulophaga sp. HaHaR_3_176]|uniref:hypothetical protein n=1 Tax=Cellulophaga sp. HaHaR_3_176 TaxID=1942464 RepID=UPI001C1FBA1A|nr:hypothetical protein [Cellulophaga sp. HaHaR_3_176]QWX82522.1 hypothetical protein H0I23_08525 [Cellulophaga sp. HaHaR_3_176]